MEILHSVLDSVKSVFITTDTWTSRATESYCCEIVTSFLISISVQSKTVTFFAVLIVT